MNIKNFLLRQSVVITISIICVIALISFSSYAAFVVQKEDADAVIIDSGYLKITYTNGNILKITDMVPTADSNIADLAGYTFSIKNDNSGIDPSSLDSNTIIKLMVNSDNQVPVEYIKCQLFSGTSSNPFATPDTTASTMQNIGKNANIIKSIILNPGNTKYYGLKVWLASNAPNSVIGKKISLKIQVDSIVNE